MNAVTGVVVTVAWLLVIAAVDALLGIGSLVGLALVVFAVYAMGDTVLDYFGGGAS